MEKMFLTGVGLFLNIAGAAICGGSGILIGQGKETGGMQTIGLVTVFTASMCFYFVGKKDKEQ